MRKTGLGRSVNRAATFLRKGVKVVEAAEVLVLRLLLFCTLVYHLVHGLLIGK
jgi:hypothetical protein